jgi:hypothetical protein
MPTAIFRPGDRVPITGVYTATHYQHRLPHNVFAVADVPFPECRRCGKRVSFCLSQSPPCIESDQDFAANSTAEDIQPQDVQSEHVREKAGGL